ncbi:Hemolymph lipopolysaccharide-binding protein [Gryllus bimaculatus]|nr:Hemolymph lipopolysaccharide-binding protein [Gryllus bimaculatus]
MGPKTAGQTPVLTAVVLGVAVSALCACAQQQRSQTTELDHTAEHKESELWNILVRNAKGHLEEKSRAETNGQITQREHPNITKRLEVVFDAETSEVLEPKSTSFHSVNKRSIPFGYSPIAGLGYYKVHREKVKWEKARRVCAKEGGHLIIINSAVEAEAVVAASRMPEWSWAGFDDYSAEGDFITLHGTTLEDAGYTLWEDGEPARDLRCGVASVKGRLGSGNCDLERGFICELHGPNEHVLEDSNNQMTVGYRPIGGLGLYRVHHDRVKWETARRRCEAEGAHLAVANTALEAAAVFRTSGLPEWFWVGFDDFDHKGNYVNFDGED